MMFDESVTHCQCQNRIECNVIEVKPVYTPQTGLQECLVIITDKNGHQWKGTMFLERVL